MLGATGMAPRRSRPLAPTALAPGGKRALLLPRPLEPGDLVHVVAPSSPFPPRDLWPGLAWLRTRYGVRISSGALSRRGFLAGGDDRRREEFARALRDPDTRAIVVARGGYGAMRIVDDLPWDDFFRRPKWIVGFSDVTAIHAMVWRGGVASIHGPNVTGLGLESSPAMRAAWIQAIERPAQVREWRNLRAIQGGTASGPLVGGNLSLLHAMAAADRLALPEGSVLALEDVGEPPYRVDRMLTSLSLAGHLARVSAIVFGGFDRCGAGPDATSIDDVLAERTRLLGVPVLAGAPFGHRAHNEAFVLGSVARVEGDRVSFEGR
jgi:muramoyltetrapeptide carboxypeptidase